mmetsp:Transcript_25566/g.52318  ORF Transcript_25566/g.52318 Transcript_25566/m.52318 type:complete len:469 (-) Transcript_25566:133-1539(-)
MRIIVLVVAAFVVRRARATPTGKVRIRVADGGRFLHENSPFVAKKNEEQSVGRSADILASNDRLISTRFQPGASSTKTQFQFYPQVDGSYRIRTVGSGRYWHEDGGAGGDKLVSTRTQPMNDYTKFFVEEYCDGSVRFRSKATGWYLHVDEGGDDLCSTRLQPGAADKKTRFFLEYVSLAEYLPANWAAMEIEAKWRIGQSTFGALVADLPDGGTLVAGGASYDLNVRWGGIARKYEDDYYDNAAGALAAAGHSYRVRSRYTSSPTASDNQLATLQAASWAFDWRKVQYKSTAVRIGATWFREETGACKIAGGTPVCTVTDLPSILAGNVLHEANAAVVADHAGFDFTTMAIATQVEDYRYRVELLVGGVEVFEVSLDRVATRTADDGFTSVKWSYEAELEIIKPSYGYADVEELMALVSYFEGAYPLFASKTSKGGTYVDDALIPGNSASCLRVPLTWAEVEKRYEL